MPIKWLLPEKNLDFYADRYSVAAETVRKLKKSIIIGGCGRSGTTLLLTVLSCHPRIMAVSRETGLFCPAAFSFPQKYDRPFPVEKIFDTFGRLPDDGQAIRFCEKTPKNICFADRILKLLGQNARFINIVRDGRDVVCSRHPAKSDRPWVSPRRWVSDVSAGRKLEGNPRVFNIRYEDLVLDYEQSVRGICDFIEEEFHPDFLFFPASAKIQSFDTWNFKTESLKVSSIGRWKKAEYENAVSGLLATPGAKELLNHYNYL